LWSVAHDETSELNSTPARRTRPFDLREDRRAFGSTWNKRPDGAARICFIDGFVNIQTADTPEERINLDVYRGCFACMLGGPNRRTLFMVVTEWRGMEKVAEVAQARTGRVLAVEVPALGLGWPQGATE
jgi:sugar lactone lactonase YvrE